MMDIDSDDEFKENMASAISSAQLARLIGTTREKETKRKRSRKPGPSPQSVKLKLYYLPDASRLPAKFLGTDPLVCLHMSQGYGK